MVTGLWAPQIMSAIERHPKGPQARKAHRLSDEITEGFNQRLPESLETGYPTVFVGQQSDSGEQQDP